MFSVDEGINSVEKSGFQVGTEDHLVLHALLRNYRKIGSRHSVASFWKSRNYCCTVGKAVWEYMKEKGKRGMRSLLEARVVCSCKSIDRHFCKDHPLEGNS